MMNKASFNYYGRLSVGGQTALLLIICVVCIWSWMELRESQEKWLLLFVTTALMSQAVWITHKLMAYLKRVECKQGKILLTHVLTRHVQIIDLKELSGYQLDGLNQSIQLTNAAGEVLATIYQPFYKNAEAFLLENGLRPINKEEMYFRWLAI
jgi:hypothetical protein